MLNTSAIPELRKKGSGVGYQGINDLD